jgi:hypothetical protein
MKFGGPQGAGLFNGLAELRNHYFFSPRSVMFAKELILFLQWLTMLSTETFGGRDVSGQRRRKICSFRA